MTTYAYTLTLSDSEMLALDAAIEHYRAFCRQQLASGEGCPYWAHARSMEAIGARLFGNAQLMSTNSFTPPGDIDTR